MQLCNLDQEMSNIHHTLHLIALNLISPARVTDNAALDIVRAMVHMPGVDAAGVEHHARLLPTAVDSTKLALTLHAKLIS